MWRLMLAGLATLFLLAQSAQTEEKAPLTPETWGDTGRVLTPDGKPCPGAKVERKLNFWDRTEQWRAKTDEKGEFRFAPRPKEALCRSLFAYAPGYALGYEVKAAAALDQPVTLRLRKHVPASVVVSDAKGKPVSGAEVEAAEPHWSSDVWLGLTVKTDAKGTARLPWFAAGDKCLLSFSHPSFARDERTLQFGAAAGKNVATVRLERGSTIVGQIVNRAKELPQISLGVDCQALKEWEKGSLRLSFRANADEKGFYRLTQLPVGSYLISVEDGVIAGYEGIGIPRAVSKSTTVRITEAGSTVRAPTLTHSGGVVLSGKVVDAETGLGVATKIGAWATKEERWNSYRYSYSQPDGRFVIRLFEGSWTVGPVNAADDLIGTRIVSGFTEGKEEKGLVFRVDPAKLKRGK